MSTHSDIFQPPINICQEAHCKSMQEYKELYGKSINDPVKFWSEIAKEFYWYKFPNMDNFMSYNFNLSKGPIDIKWMPDGITNICYNALDRIILDNKCGDKIAFYWEGNDPNDTKQVTYSQLLKKVCQFSNFLKSKGIKKGDKVAIYMPMILELLIAMLGCSRLGVVHSIIFGGFSIGALSDRLMDGNCQTLITTDGAWRGDKLLHLKDVADGAFKICAKRGFKVNHCLVVKHLSTSDNYTSCQNYNNHHEEKEILSTKVGCRPHSNLQINWNPERDLWWHREVDNQKTECEPEWLSAEDPLFILYTSGSTGKPKGVLHTQGGYMLYTWLTFKYVFDHHPNKDVYFCTADIGWITGHSYVCYGPLLNGATSVMFEGIPFYPNNSRYWEIIDKYKVNKFYTAPTAIRALMKLGDSYVQKCCLNSLKILGTVGEPINPEAWWWYYNVVGKSKCAIVDTFWQTETGGHVITPLPGATPTKPGSATFPFFGVSPVILSEEGNVIEGVGEGYLVFDRPWPGIMRTVYGNHERFESVYFNKFKGYYTSGDGAKRDSDGYLWITGRIDDMLNVSGHLISTAEVESALVEHHSIAEAAAVAHPHKVKGECLYCFVTLKDGESFTPQLVTELKKIVREKIAPFAQPDYIQEAPGLPKTRSGKIMRRVLRAIAMGDHNLGDISTLADESVVEQLFNMRIDVKA